MQDVSCYNVPYAAADKVERPSWRKKVNREEVFIVGEARTPIGRLSGALSAVPAPKLGAEAIRGALEQTGQMDYTLRDNVLQAGMGQAPARQAAIGAGIPVIAPAMTVNKVCASGSGFVEADEGPRAETSPEALAVLAPAFSQGRSVTAGNASQISDGAAAVILAGESTVARLGLSPIVKTSGYARAGVEPAWLFEGPVAATRAPEAKTGPRLADFDLVETNEAFATLANSAVLDHPLPMNRDGARILVTLLHARAQRGARHGLATICHGGGGGVVLSVELA